MGDMWNNVTVFGPATEIDRFKRLSLNPSENITTAGQSGWDGCDCIINVATSVVGTDDREDGTVFGIYVYNFQQFTMKSGNEFSFSFDTDTSFPEQVFHALAACFPKLAFDCSCIEALDECMGFGWFNGPPGGEQFRQDYAVPKDYWSSGSGRRRSRRAQVAHEARIDALLEAARQRDRIAQMFGSGSLA